MCSGSSGYGWSVGGAARPLLLEGLLDVVVGRIGQQQRQADDHERDGENAHSIRVTAARGR